MSDLRLKNKIAVITGGARSIGEAIVRRFTKEGAFVVIVDRDLAEAQALDILVNNAGVNTRKRPDDFSEADWSSIIDTNLKAAFLCSQAVHPAMQRAKGGKIIMIGSLAAIFSHTMSPVYAASKVGFVQLAKSLAVAWAQDNIQVNTINPGNIATDLVKVGLAQAPETFSQVLPRTPAGRWGTPDNFAGIAIFLASKASDFFTGTSIAVDGGYSVRY